MVALERPDLDADTYRSQLWRIPLINGPAIALTTGERDAHPVISPDGRWIAFTRRVEGKAQLALLDARGGEARVLTQHPLGISGAAVFSPTPPGWPIWPQFPRQGDMAHPRVWARTRNPPGTSPT